MLLRKLAIRSNGRIQSSGRIRSNEAEEVFSTVHDRSADKRVSRSGKIIICSVRFIIATVIDIGLVISTPTDQVIMRSPVSDPILDGYSVVQLNW